MPFPAVVYILLSYLAGAVPFGLLVSRSSGIDIRTRGSKNIGATNVSRLLGKKLGAITLVLDICKGCIPMLLVSMLVSDMEQGNLIVALCGAASVLGHMFPVYLGFRGGKGVATGLGVFLFLAPLAVLGCLLVFAGTVYLSGFVSLGSLLASAAVVPWLLFLDAPAWKVYLALFVAVLIWGKHYQNIGRLLSGTEKSWKMKTEDPS